jgi:chemotaxis protein CheY-P-specific phosphatase CheC
MEKCMAKLTRVSAGKWGVAGISVTRRNMDEAVNAPSSAGPGAAVYFEVSGEYPFTSMVMFRPEDMEIISRGYLGFSFSKLPVLNQAQELMLSELGNIILNAFISALSNALGRSFLPAAPKSVQGEPEHLLGALWATLDQSQRYSVATVTLDLRCDNEITRSEVIAVIPESLELALAAAEKK